MTMLKMEFLNTTFLIVYITEYYCIEKTRLFVYTNTVIIISRLSLFYHYCIKLLYHYYIHQLRLYYVIIMS